MILQQFDVPAGRYDINVKLSLPEEQEVKGIVLGVHGFASSKESSTLQAVAERCASVGVALLRFDLPAHGASPVGEDQFIVENCLQDVLFMADYCRNKFPEAKRYCFATSFGGFLSLLAYPRLNDFKTVLRAPAVTMPQHVFLDLIEMSAETFKTAGPVDAGLDRPLVLDYRFYEDLVQYDVLETDYAQNMLVLEGTNDDVVPLQDILSFCNAHPCMNLKTIEGAGHRFTKPGELEQALDYAFDFWGM